jgi:restriction system protein
MGYVQEELADDGQSVVGIIIALEDDQKIRWALKMTPNIEFYRYQISFKLAKGSS